MCSLRSPSTILRHYIVAGRVSFQTPFELGPDESTVKKDGVEWAVHRGELAPARSCYRGSLIRDERTGALLPTDEARVISDSPEIVQIFAMVRQWALFYVPHGAGERPGEWRLGLPDCRAGP